MPNFFSNLRMTSSSGSGSASIAAAFAARLACFLAFLASFLAFLASFFSRLACFFARLAAAPSLAGAAMRSSWLRKSTNSPSKPSSSYSFRTRSQFLPAAAFLAIPSLASSRRISASSGVSSTSTSARRWRFLDDGCSFRAEAASVPLRCRFALRAGAWAAAGSAFRGFAAREAIFDDALRCTVAAAAAWDFCLRARAAAAWAAARRCFFACRCCFRASRRPSTFPTPG